MADAVVPDRESTNIAMSDDDPPAPPDKLTCPLCGRPNDCKAACDGPCWCAGRPVLREKLEKALGPFSLNSACLCIACLRRFERVPDGTDTEAAA